MRIVTEAELERILAEEDDEREVAQALEGFLRYLEKEGLA